MAGPNLVSFQGTANTQNPNTSEIPVSAANPLPVTITEGNLSLGNVTVSSGNVTVTGDVANGSADSGNPVKVGGIFNAAPALVAEGQRVNWGMGPDGSGYITLTGPATVNGSRVVLAADAQNADGLGTGLFGLTVSADQFRLNPAGTRDRVRIGPYQLAQTPIINASGNKANATAAATLTGTSTTTVYLAGFEVTSSGATVGVAVSVTVTGILGGTLTYTFVVPAGALLQSNPLIVTFNPPIPASAINTPIAVSLPALGTGNTNAAVVAHGFYQ